MNRWSRVLYYFDRSDGHFSAWCRVLPYVTADSYLSLCRRVLFLFFFFFTFIYYVSRMITQNTTRGKTRDPYNPFHRYLGSIKPLILTLYNTSNEQYRLAYTIQYAYKYNIRLLCEYLSYIHVVRQTINLFNISESYTWNIPCDKCVCMCFIETNYKFITKNYKNGIVKCEFAVRSSKLFSSDWCLRYLYLYRV